MSDTSNVLIFFVGLALWTNQMGTNETGMDRSVHVVLPTVHHVAENQNQTNVMSAHALPHNMVQEAQITPRNLPYVEEHATYFIAHTSSFPANTNSGWPSPKRIGKSDFSYVALNVDPGVHLQFITQGRGLNSPLTTITPLLPRLTGVTTLDPNFAYPRAAAVFDVPVGTMKSCLSLTRIGKPRLDTKLALSTTGDLVVASGEKQLHITPDRDGSIMLLVANIPPRYLDGDYGEFSPDRLARMSHVNAYYALTTASCGSCTQTLKQWFDNHMEELEPCHSDVTNIAGRAIATTTTPTPMCDAPNAENTIAGIVQGANYMCSNEAWP